ncbi:hypothetical protein AB0I77_08605 [Streptomyces sp. NPDC050619]|uniref:hypothetical protein n=1 Tax=Streptomyces sp. NPDC050619 TaxID=3157214 RepID=UPI0034332EB4
MNPTHDGLIEGLFQRLLKCYGVHIAVLPNAPPVLAIVRESTPTEDGGDEWPRLNFASTLSSGKGDLAAGSSEILRTELGRQLE